MAFLIRADRKYSGTRGPYLGHIPGIWSRDWQPIEEAIDYLIAKGTGRWTAGQDRSEFAQISPLSEHTMLAIGYDLTNFFDWIESQNLCWKTAGSQFLLQAYTTDLRSGALSKRSQNGLAEATVKRRANSVAEFLAFSGAKTGHPCNQLLLPAPPNPPGRHQDPRVRHDPSRLRLPSLSEIEQWLRELKALHGIAPYLMAKSVFGMGLRSDEVLSLHDDQLPAIPSPLAKTVAVEICYGTKGKRLPSDPTRRGKARTVRSPTSLLIELRTYSAIDRKLALATFRRKNPGAALPRELFLSKLTGRPFSYSRFYEMWRGPSAPFDHFSPHLGRHAWACYTLLEKIKEEVFLLSENTASLAAVVGNVGPSLIEIWISPQLGHVDSRTSNLYLSWVADALDCETHTDSWFDFLDG